jgi:hypothetical protein
MKAYLHTRETVSLTVQLPTAGKWHNYTKISYEQKVSGHLI